MIIYLSAKSRDTALSLLGAAWEGGGSGVSTQSVGKRKRSLALLRAKS